MPVSYTHRMVACAGAHRSEITVHFFEELLACHVVGVRAGQPFGNLLAQLVEQVGPESVSYTHLLYEVEHQGG